MEEVLTVWIDGEIVEIKSTTRNYMHILIALSKLDLKVEILEKNGKRTPLKKS